MSHGYRLTPEARANVDEIFMRHFDLPGAAPSPRPCRLGEPGNAVKFPWQLAPKRDPTLRDDGWPQIDDDWILNKPAESQSKASLHDKDGILVDPFPHDDSIEFLEAAVSGPACASTASEHGESVLEPWSD